MLRGSIFTKNPVKTDGWTRENPADVVIVAQVIMNQQSWTEETQLGKQMRKAGRTLILALTNKKKREASQYNAGQLCWNDIRCTQRY